MTTKQFAELLLRSLWPLTLIGVAGSLLLFRDLIKKLKGSKRHLYRIRR